MNLMQITLTVDLTDDDAASIANVKHTQPDDVAEINDYLTGYLEGAIEAAQSDAHGDVAVGVAPVAVGALMLTETQVIDTLNKACQDVIEAAQLPETGARDALNLLVNATSIRLREPEQTLEQVAEQAYQETLATILEWIAE
jgi:AICAR transformylase/IMP cyclohydrolase PurH